MGGNLEFGMGADPPQARLRRDNEARSWSKAERGAKV